MTSEEPVTEIKAAHLEADNHADLAGINAEQDSYALIHALLALERRVYWHGLIMQQS